MKKREPILEAYEEPAPLEERNLIAAIMARAFSDVLNEVVDGQIAYRNANGWIRSNSNKPFSFIWCCLALDLSALHVRTRVLEMKAKGERLELERRRVEENEN